MTEQTAEKCLICGSRVVASWPEARTLVNSLFDGEVVRCRDCGFCWISPIPDDGVASYGEDYFQAYETAGQVMPAASAQGGPLEARLARLEHLVGKPGRVLDVGIGDAGFLRAASRRGWEVVGTDISGYAANEARRKYGIEVIEGALESSDLQPGHFDAVHMSHVIEHLRDPIAGLRKVRQCLRGGGWLVVEVPNEFANGLTRLRLALGLARPYPVRSTHVYFFDPSTLPKLLEAQGFTVRSLRTFREIRVGGALGRVARALVATIEGGTSGSPLLEVYAQSTSGSDGSDE